jgi:hypothetical protein
MKINLRVIAAAGLAAALSGIGAAPALADTVEARFTYTNLVVANVVSPVLTGNVNTVRFHWTRIDTPGPGVDDTVAPNFASFCIDLAKHVRANTNYEYEVFAPDEIGWSPSRILSMQMLWADRFHQVNNNDTSAAFQLAVWELVYDTDRSLSTGSFRATAPGSAISIAQGWLDGLTSGTSANQSLPNLRLLISEGAQNQITVQIPSPGSAACAMLGLAMLTNRRRRRN